MAQTEENSIDWWNDLMIRTAIKMTKTFEDNNIAFTDALILTRGTRGMMKWIYHHLVRRKMIVSLEELDAESKKQTWAFIREICAGKTNDISVMKEVTMAFCVIEYFINNK